MADPYDTTMAETPAGLPLRKVLASLHYAYPTAVFFYYMATTTVAVCTLRTSSTEHPRRRTITRLLMFVIVTYFAQLLALVVQGFVRSMFPLGDQDTVIGLMSCALAYGVVFAGLSDAESPVWHPYIGPLGVGLVFEPAIETLTLMVRPAEPLKIADFFDIFAVAARYLAIILALVFYFVGNRSIQQENATDAERQALLKTDDNTNNETDSDGQSEGARQNGYGATSDASSDSNQSSDTDGDENPYERRQRQASEQMEKRLREKGNWITYAKSFKVRY